MPSPRLFMLTTLAAIAGTLTPIPASADPHADLAYAVQESANPSRGWIVGKLMTFNLAPKCWEKVNAKHSRPMELISAHASSIAKLATTWTGDDWAGILTQNANSREKNKELVEPMVDAFKSKFHVTINVEGDDCEATGNAMWLKYLGTTTTALAQFPPKSGKAFVTINVTSKAKGAKTEISKDGTTFTITAGRDIEKSGWPSDIESPIKRVSSKN